MDSCGERAYRAYGPIAKRGLCSIWRQLLLRYCHFLSTILVIFPLSYNISYYSNVTLTISSLINWSTAYFHSTIIVDLLVKSKPILRVINIITKIQNVAFDNGINFETINKLIKIKLKQHYRLHYSIVYTLLTTLHGLWELRRRSLVQYI